MKKQGTMPKSLLLISMFLFLAATGFCQQDTTLMKDEVVILKTVASQYQIWKWVVIIAGVILPFLSFFGIKHVVGKWAEDKAMAKLADKLNVQKEVLESALQLMLKEHKLKERKILLVSPEKGQPLSVTEFLKAEGFFNLDFMELKDLKDYAPAKIDLMLFNYLNQNLPEKEPDFGKYLIKFKDNARILVLGTGHLPPNYKTTLGNRLSYSNGFDTLTERILGAYKQPV